MAHEEGQGGRQDQEAHAADPLEHPVALVPFGQPVGRGLAHGRHRFRPLEAVQVLGQFPGAGIALPGVLLQALGDDGREVPGDGGDALTEGNGRVLGHGLQEALEITGPEGAGAGHHHVQHHAEGVDVRPGADPGRVPGQLLRARVGGRSQAAATAGRLRSTRHHPEVADDGVEDPILVAFHEDVAELQVQMDEALLVRGVDPQRDVPDDPDFFPKIEGRNELGQGRALHELHDQVPLAHFVDSADIGVLDLRLGPRLLQDRPPRVLERLDGHVPLEQGIQALVDEGARPFPDRDEILVAVPQTLELPDRRGPLEQRIDPGPRLAADGLPGQAVEREPRHPARGQERGEFLTPEVALGVQGGRVIRRTRVAQEPARMSFLEDPGREVRGEHGDGKGPREDVADGPYRPRMACGKDSSGHILRTP